MVKRFLRNAAAAEKGDYPIRLDWIHRYGVDVERGELKLMKHYGINSSETTWEYIDPNTGLEK